MSYCPHIDRLRAGDTGDEIMNRKGCYRCQSKCTEKSCRVCAKKILCQACTPETNKRANATH